MTDDDNLTFEAARDRLRQATKIILDLEHEYAEAVQAHADAEAVYRAELAKAFDNHRSAGDAVEAAKIKAHGDTATLKRDAIASAGMVKVQADKVENARDSRRSLWRLIEWAAQRERRAANMVARDDERVPGETWP
jgi:hypothetical protein